MYLFRCEKLKNETLFFEYCQLDTFRFYPLTVRLSY